MSSSFQGAQQDTLLPKLYPCFSILDPCTLRFFNAISGHGSMTRIMWLRLNLMVNSVQLLIGTGKLLYGKFWQIAVFKLLQRLNKLFF